MFERFRWRLRSRPRRCACGEMVVAKGTRTELRGVSHGETPCYECDTYGQPR